MTEFVGVCLGGPLDGKKIRHSRSIMLVQQEDGKPFYYALSFGAWWPYRLGGEIVSPTVVWDYLLTEYMKSRRDDNGTTDTPAD